MTSLQSKFNSEEWVRESAKIERETGGQIEAGLSLKRYAERKYDPAAPRPKDLKAFFDSIRARRKHSNCDMGIPISAESASL